MGSDSVTVGLRVAQGLYPGDSMLFSSPARNGWRLKLARAKEATGPPSQQSKARKSPALPEAEQARAAFSTRVMLIRPLPLRFFAARFDDLEPIAPFRVWLRRLRSINRHISSLIRFVGRNVEPFRERLVAMSPSLES
ncbi:hypothetical protein Bca101_076542 [Brassica carinata]